MKGLAQGTKVRFNGNAPRSFTEGPEKVFTVDKVMVLPKGTKSGASLGVLNMCKKRDVTVVKFKKHPKYLTPIPVRFISIVSN